MFFDDYQQFFDTSTVLPKRGRLNLRYEAIFGANSDVFEGARVLDLASHDGRWSFAALRTGAAHVTGIEAREEAVSHANANLAHYGADPDTYRFLCGDIFDVLGQKDFEVDVVLCLGYMYHTYRHTELLYRIRQINPKFLMMDSTVVPDMEEPFLKVYVDRPHRPGQATLDEFAHGSTTLVARPSVPALQMMLRAYDFEIEDTCDWHALMAKYPEAGRVDDYAEGKRVTMRCRSGVSIPPVPDPPASFRTRRGAASATAPPSAEPSLATGPAKTLSVKDQPVEQGVTAKRWRELVNRGLARTTGYQFRRSEQNHD